MSAFAIRPEAGGQIRQDILTTEKTALFKGGNLLFNYVCFVAPVASNPKTIGRDGEVTFEKELSYNYSYFQVRTLGTLVTSVTVTTIKS